MKTSYPSLTELKCGFLDSNYIVVLYVLGTPELKLVGYVDVELKQIKQMRNNPNKNWKRPTFWMGLASLFDFAGSIPASLTDDIVNKTVGQSLRQDAKRVASDMRRVYNQEEKKM